MNASLRLSRNRITFWFITAFLLTSLTGQIGALAFNLLEPQQLAVAFQQGVFPAFVILLLFWSSTYAWQFIDPLFQWWHTHAKEGAAAPSALWQRLHQFSYVFWSFFLVQSIVGSYLLLHSVEPQLIPSDAIPLLKLILCQLAASLLIGMPIYILVIEEIGQLVAHLGLERVHFGIRTKMFIMGALIPMLGYGILVRYFEANGTATSQEARLIWMGLVIVTLATTFFSIRSLRKSLTPVLNILSKAGASRHQDLAKLCAHSTDEIGFFSQTLGKLFSRLLEQESQVKAVIDKAAEGIIVLDEQGMIETFNRAAEEVFGYCAQEVRGRSLRWLMPSVVLENGLPNLLHNGHELKGEHKDGKERVLFFRVTQMQVGEKVMYSCLVHDITDRKNAERKLLKAESRYRNLVETAHDLVWSMDIEGRWTYLNEAASSIYGYAPNEMIGHRFADFQAPESMHQDQNAFDRLLGGKELVQYETIHLDILDQSRYLSFNAKPVLDEKGNIIKFSGTARDITEQKAFEKRLAYQAEHDSLTGLFNRNYFNQELERVVARAGRALATCALFYVDLDQFKYVNDTLGHAAGDRLLIEISNLLQSSLRETDLVARFGGDEFTLLLYNTDKEQALWLADNLLARFEQYRFFDSGNSFNVMCSIGISLINTLVKSADEALSQADIACNLAKAHGRNRAEFFNPEQEDLQGMAEDMGWAARIRETLENDRLRLVFQPIVRTNDGAICDYEVLMRMVCADGKVIMPGGFLPAAERFGLIHSLDRWMVKKSIQRSTNACQRNQGSLLHQFIRACFR